jgi:hypothetical protein
VTANAGRDMTAATPPALTIARVWKAAASKADPRQQHDWILKCLQGGRAHPLAACGVATLCSSPPWLLLEPKPYGYCVAHGGGRRYQREGCSKGLEAAAASPPAW